MLLEERERGEVTRKQGAKGQSPRHSGLRQEPPETGSREAEMEKPLAGGGGVGSVVPWILRPPEPFTVHSHNDSSGYCYVTNHPNT